jgi:hypothetical protein
MGFFSRGAGAAAKKRAAERSYPYETQKRHPGVEVIPDRHACCSAAREIAGQRFLCNEAPRLPLAGCDQQECGCRYQHYTDRRTEVRRDRDIGIGLTSEMFRDNCRRTSSKGRRSDDEKA